MEFPLVDSLGNGEINSRMLAPEAERPAAVFEDKEDATQVGEQRLHDQFGRYGSLRVRRFLLSFASSVFSNNVPKSRHRLHSNLHTSIRINSNFSAILFPFLQVSSFIFLLSFLTLMIFPFTLSIFPFTRIIFLPFTLQSFHFIFISPPLLIFLITSSFKS